MSLNSGLRAGLARIEPGATACWIGTGADKAPAAEAEARRPQANGGKAGGTSRGMDEVLSRSLVRVFKDFDEIKAAVARMLIRVEQGKGRKLPPRSVSHPHHPGKRPAKSR